MNHCKRINSLQINMRRGFLDKRSCIETTFKLKYEKEQEVSSFKSRFQILQISTGLVVYIDTSLVTVTVLTISRAFIYSSEMPLLRVIIGLD